jgi:hypothetical protein
MKPSSRKKIEKNLYPLSTNGTIWEKSSKISKRISSMPNPFKYFKILKKPQKSTISIKNMPK